MKIVVIGGTGLIGPADDARLGEMRFADWLNQNTRGVPQATPQPAGRAAVNDNEFRLGDVPPGSALLVGDVAVFNVDGRLCATQAECPHRQGPLAEGDLSGSTVTCPLHGSQFDVFTGAVLRGPAQEPLKTYAVVVEGDVGRIDEPL